MNLTHGISNSFVEKDGAKSRLKIRNLTRQTVLAHSVEVADHGAARRKGLLGRDGLPAGEGMWIVPCESVHTFWMKFPIDLVYLDRNKKVKKVRSSVGPWRLSACLSAHSVLEFAAGTIGATQTQPGDVLEFSPCLPMSDTRMEFGVSAPTEPTPGHERTMAMPMQPNKLRAIFEFLVVGICTASLAIIVVGICAALLAKHAPGSRDFVEYWTSAQLLAHHANPYDESAILRIERSLGYPSNVPALVMWNPPHALLLILPLGFVGSRTGLLLWSLFVLASLFASVRMVWIMHGRPNELLNVLGYSFAPALVCLLAGQVSIFILLGLVLFLRLHGSRPFLAGMSLWLCLLKPHLFLPFGVVLLVWAIATRSYKLLAGVAVAMGVSTGIVLLWDPSAWSQYAHMMNTLSTERLKEELIPCFSIMLRWTISPKTMWLQYVPPALACVWALAYFRRHRENWHWMEHGSLLMIVSVVFAPYSWLMDQAILIPALLHAAYLTRSRNLIAVLALASAAIDIGALRGVAILHSLLYLWTAPAWLVWYLYAIRRSEMTNVYEPPPVVVDALMGSANKANFGVFPGNSDICRL
jgi:uncharacterized protein